MLELYQSSHIERFKSGVWRTLELQFLGIRCFELIVSFPTHAEVVSQQIFMSKASINVVTDCRR